MPKGIASATVKELHLIYEVVEFVGRWSMIGRFRYRGALGAGAYGRFNGNYLYPAMWCINVCFESS